MNTSVVLDGLPMRRPPGRPFDPPAELAQIRASDPLCRMRFPDGQLGWLATGHAAVRSVLAHPGFNTRYELLHLPCPIDGLGPLPPAPPGDPSGVDAPAHTRYRRAVAAKFTAPRMRQLTERTSVICADALCAMRSHGPGADLVTAYAQPVPALVICELLGVTYVDGDQFSRQVQIMSSLTAGETQRMSAWTAVTGFIGELVQRKRIDPTDDLFSDLTRSDLDDGELAGLGTFLLGAGFDTTANMIALGTFALLHPPSQAELLWDSADLAVEELMRYLSIVPTLVRAALTDVTINGHVVRATESVALAVQAANRDPLRFENPDVLDLRRDPSGQLAFGHGIHKCLGQHLARMELRVALPALFAAFPRCDWASPLQVCRCATGTTSTAYVA